MVARTLRVALVGDFNAAVVAHRAIPMALNLASRQHGVEVQPLWAHTSSIFRVVDAQFASFDGIWCVPASPYANTLGALAVIRYARETGRPFLGTCGGFQHALLEYARNVCEMAEAAHAETDPGAALPLIAPLACSLVERSDEIVLAEGGQFRRVYGQAQITEGYHCSYGLNREYESRIFRDGLRATAHDRNGEVRGVELVGHPFFVAALFQPERRAMSGEVPPLAAAFVAAMAG
jgi:CTP synthase (UTP-ammonia lyase)